MKTRFRPHFLFLLILFVTSSLGIKAQQEVPSFTYTIANQSLVSENVLEFDVYLLNTKPSVKFEVSGVQLCITVNPAIINDGTITPSVVSGTSEMDISQVPTALQFDNANSVGPMLKVAVTNCNFGSSTVVSGTAPGTRVCRFRLTNSKAFGSAKANLQHRLVIPVYRSLLSYWDQGSDGLGMSSTDSHAGDYLNLPLTISNTYSTTTDPVLNSMATVTTDAVNATTNVASGTLSALGAPNATDYGFVYSTTNATPTILDSHISKGAPSTTGAYTGKLTGMTGGSTYYVRAYATNTAGTAYGSVISYAAADLKPKNLSYTTPNAFTTNVAITALTPTVTGDVTAYAVSPALPVGLIFNTTTGVISGTPTVLSAATNYTVTATNTEGNVQAIVNIAVNDVIPSSLNYTTPNVFTKGTAIGSLTPTVSGGAVTGYSISPALPTGLSINPTTGVIYGTPTAVAALTSYTVTASNSGGATTKAIDITVKDIAPSGLSYPTNITLIKGTLMTNLIPTVGGGTVTDYSVSPALPNGISIDPVSGIISGTPTTVSDPTVYTITAANTGGSTTFQISIKVQDAARQLALKMIFEGLWNNTKSKMAQCLTEDGVTPKYTTSSDTITIELRDAANYSKVIHTVGSLLLEPDGTVHSDGKSYVDISGEYKGNYYMTIKSRNHMQTISASPISLANEHVTFDLSAQADNAFGSNQALPKVGVNALYAGDINQDGVIDNMDVVKLQSKLKSFGSGYINEDLNGDGVADNMDAVILLRNTKKFIYIKEP